MGLDNYVRILAAPTLRESTPILVRRTRVKRTLVTDHLMATWYDPPSTWLRKQLG